MTSPGDGRGAVQRTRRRDVPSGPAESPWLCLCSGRCPQASHFTLGQRGHWSGVVTHSASRASLEGGGVSPSGICTSVLSTQRVLGRGVQDVCGGARPSHPAGVQPQPPPHVQPGFQNSAWNVGGLRQHSRGPSFLCPRGDMHRDA